MVELILLVIVIALIIGVFAAVTGKSRYSDMSEEEFNKEAQRATMRGAGVAEFQRIVDPSHKVEYLQQRDKHVEAEKTDSGDRPPGDSRSK